MSGSRMAAWHFSSRCWLFFTNISFVDTIQMINLSTLLTLLWDNYSLISHSSCFMYEYIHWPEAKVQKNVLIFSQFWKAFCCDPAVLVTTRHSGYNPVDGNDDRSASVHVVLSSRINSPKWFRNIPAQADSLEKHIDIYLSIYHLW